MRLVVYSLTGCLLCSAAVAKYCVKLPTCEELGYIYSVDKYPNNRSIKCPFDTKKILLLDYCQAYGLTSCDSTSGECDECIVEKADGTKSNSGYWRYTRCNAGYSYVSGECLPTEIDRDQYPLISEQMNEEIGDFECVNSGKNIYCKYNSCKDGWDFNSGNCIVHDCGSDYSYTTCDTNGACEECKSGANMKYSAPVCNAGWYTSGGSCVENDCSAFTSSTNSISGCSSASSCLSGTKMTYKCDICYTGYEVTNGTCDKTCSYTATALPTNCATATGSCQLGSASGTTTYYATTCSSCNNGYIVSSGSCVLPCAGYYDCGGPWQYCTGSLCSADSTKCSVYCVNDYFPNECDNASWCQGVYRSGWCSGSCENPDPCVNFTGPGDYFFNYNGSHFVHSGDLGVDGYGSTNTTYMYTDRVCYAGWTFTNATVEGYDFTTNDLVFGVHGNQSGGHTTFNVHVTVNGTIYYFGGATATFNKGLSGNYNVVRD